MAKANCPNCGSPADRNGNEVTCEACDSVFIVKKKGGASVKEVGRLAKIEARLNDIEAVLPGQIDPPDPPEEIPDDPSNLPDEEEDW